MARLQLAGAKNEPRPVRPRRSPAAAWFGIAGFAALSMIGALLPGNLRAAERELQDRAERALAQLGGTEGVRVALRGQAAILTGTVADEATRRAALEAVLGSTDSLLGRGGEWAGGVTKAIDRLEVLGKAGIWRARRARFGGLTIDGAGPNAAADRFVANKARDLFPEYDAAGAAPLTAASSNAPSPPADAPVLDPQSAWAKAAASGLAALAHLSEAEIAFAGDQATIDGCAPDRNALEAARKAAAAAPKPYAIAFSVEDEGNLGPLAPSLCLRPNAAQCQSAFDALMKGPSLRFGVNAIIADAPDPQFLTRLGAAARRCARFALTAEGYADNRGGAAANLKLSLRRAAFLRDYLLAAGLRPETLRLAGLGSAHPLCPNDTPEGQACNRRAALSVGAELVP